MVAAEYKVTVDGISHIHYVTVIPEPAEFPGAPWVHCKLLLSSQRGSLSGRLPLPVVFFRKSKFTSPLRVIGNRTLCYTRIMHRSVVPQHAYARSYRV